MKLEDKTSGELFAKCPIDKYPGLALEAVTDSSRYFVVRIQDDNGMYKVISTYLIMMRYCNTVFSLIAIIAYSNLFQVPFF